MKVSEVQMKRLWEKIETGRRSPLRRGLRTALLAAAIVAALCMSALALSPTLRQALLQALGDYAPYSQSVEGAVTVQNGIEIKVVSAMADSAMVRVYAEARDLTGDRLGADMGVWGMVERAVPESVTWIYSYAGGGTCVGYDPETKTALLEINSYGALPNDLKGAELQILSLYPHKDDWGNKIGEEHWSIPLTIERMEERLVPITGTVWGAKLRAVVISPLGITVQIGAREEDQNIRTNLFAVQLDDGTFLHPKFAGMGGDSYAAPDPVSLTCFSFDDPTLADRVTGVAFGYWFIPIDGETAGAGYWLKEQP